MFILTERDLSNGTESTLEIPLTLVESNEEVTCAWCGKEFNPLGDLSYCYALTTAGTKICTDCADKWELKEIELHSGHIRGFINDGEQHVSTYTGQSLPIMISTWRVQVDRHGRRKARGTAIDNHGRKWQVDAVYEPNEESTLAKIKPVRGKA